MEEVNLTYRDRIRSAAQFLNNEFGVVSLSIFGSVARNEQSEDSDIDIIVEMPPKALKVVELKDFLQTLLGKKVDIVRNRPSLDPFFKKQIEKDAINII